MVSMVKSRFQMLRVGSLERSTCVIPCQHIVIEVSGRCCVKGSVCTFPVLWSTHGRLTLLMKVTSGGESG